MTYNKVTSTVLYVCGYGRSGSTLLDTTLASEFGLLSAGELCHLSKASSYPCGCGKLVDCCELWGPLLSDLPLAPGRDEQIHSVGRASRNYAEYWRKVFAHTAQAGWPLVVDSSKSAWRQAKRPGRLREIGIDVQPVLIWRDFDGVLGSRLAAHERRQGSGCGRWRLQFIELETALSWSVANIIALHYVRKANEGHVLSLSRFVACTEEALKLFESTVHRSCPPASNNGFGNHSVAGNRLRLEEPARPSHKRQQSPGTRRSRFSWWITRPIELLLERESTELSKRRPHSSE